MAVLLIVTTKKIQCSGPENIKPAKSVNVTLSYDNAIIEWSPASPGVYCNVNYHIYVTSEKNMLNETIQDPRFELERNFVCYRGLFVIEAVIGNTIAEIGQGEIRYEIQQPTNLQLTVSPRYIIVTWDFTPVQTSCNIAFDVTVHRDYMVNTVTAFNTYTELLLLYCVNTTVDVRATNFIDQSNGITATLPEKYPTSLDPVQNIIINSTETSAIVSWEVPIDIRECTDLYTVHARNEETGEESQCQGTTECEIKFINTFCPTTEFTIGPTSLNGNPVTETYSCIEDVLI